MKYYLTPGSKVAKKGLTGNQLIAKSGQYLEISDKDAKVLENNLEFLISEKRVITGEQYAAIVAKEEKKSGGGDGKSEKRLALEAEAAELGIEFDDNTTQKDLAAAIEEAKKESGE